MSVSEHYQVVSSAAMPERRASARGRGGGSKTVSGSSRAKRDLGAEGLDTAAASMVEAEVGVVADEDAAAAKAVRSGTANNKRDMLSDVKNVRKEGKLGSDEDVEEDEHFGTQMER